MPYFSTEDNESVVTGDCGQSPSQAAFFQSSDQIWGPWTTAPFGTETSAALDFLTEMMMQTPPSRTYRLAILRSLWA